MKIKQKSTFFSSFSRFIVISLTLSALALQTLPLPPSENYPWTPSQDIQALEEKFKAAVSPDYLRSFLMALTAEPHPPGSQGDRGVENYIYARMERHSASSPETIDTTSCFGHLCSRRDQFNLVSDGTGILS